MTRRFINPFSVIVEPGRQRREFDEQANQDLQSSIQSVGLLHAPVLELVGEQYVLRAGERRLIAIREIYELNGRFSYDGETVPEGMLPYTLWQDLTELQRLELEVDENNQRQEFTWPERAAATAALARLRSLQAEALNAPKPTVADIALEARGSSKGSFHTDTRNDLILAANLHDPEVAKAKTAREAMTILKRKEQTAYHQRLAEAVGQSSTASRHSVYNADSRLWCAGQESEQFDIILTDPPYGIGADTFGTSENSTAVSHRYEDSPENLHVIIEWFAPESYRLAKPQAHLYLFCDLDFFFEWSDALTAAGWKVFRTPLIWVKPTGFRTPWITQGPQRKYELCLYAVKGEKAVNMVAGDVITLQSAGEGLGHSAGKPPALAEELLRRSVKPGDAVLDLFAGTGFIIPACEKLNCLSTTVEQIPEFYGICLDRISKLTPTS